MTAPLALEPAVLPSDAIEIGRITDAWGVKGWFKVLSYSLSLIHISEPTRPY